MTTLPYSSTHDDSAPGIAVDSIRNEVRELRQTVVSCSHATEGFRGLVVNLSEQIINNSIIPIYTDYTACTL